jgi:hypothetical protein
VPIARANSYILTPSPPHPYIHHSKTHTSFVPSPHLPLRARPIFCHRPAKVTGVDHPDVIVETATLASVTPPDPTYTVHKGVQVSRRGTGTRMHGHVLHTNQTRAGV